MSKIEIVDFLKSNGFKLIEQNNSSYFNDFYKILTNENLELRISSTKSFESIDVRSASERGKWFDLALIKSLLYNENNLNKVTTAKEYTNFLINDFNSINQLFMDLFYTKTKIQLNELGVKRAKQMFPEQFE